MSQTPEPHGAMDATRYGGIRYAATSSTKCEVIAETIITIRGSTMAVIILTPKESPEGVIETDESSPPVYYLRFFMTGDLLPWSVPVYIVNLHKWHQKHDASSGACSSEAAPNIVQEIAKL